MAVAAAMVVHPKAAAVAESQGAAEVVMAEPKYTPALETYPYHRRQKLLVFATVV